MSVITWPFIEHDVRGIAYVEGTRVKVIEIVLDRLAYAWDADDIHRQYPHLSLPQIHAALGYYYENRDECDRLIRRELQDVDEWRQQLQNPVLASRLRSHRNQN